MSSRATNWSCPGSTCAPTSRIARPSSTIASAAPRGAAASRSRCRRWPRCWPSRSTRAPRRTRSSSRVRESLDAVSTVLEARGDDVERLWSAQPLRFEESEQALLLGHPLHPTPKGLCGRLRQYTPELRPQFRLHWLSVDADIVAHDSATGTPAPELAARLLGSAAPHGRILIPAHPWEAGYLARAAVGPVHRRRRDRPRARTATRSRRPRRCGRSTAPQWPYMLKFSLHARVDELDAGLAAQGAAAGGRGGAAGADAGRRGGAPDRAATSRSCTTPRTCRSRARTASPCSSARTAGRALPT